MIWCVEDDASIRDIEVYALKSAGLDARGFEDGSSFLKALEAEAPDARRAGRDAAGVDGMELLRRMRESARLKTIPVIMATARDAEIDKIQGLDTGADYYLTKPFGVLEFVSCVKAVLRRCETPKAPRELRLDGLVMNLDERTVTADGKPVQLTYKNSSFCACFSRTPASPYARPAVQPGVGRGFRRGNPHDRHAYPYASSEARPLWRTDSHHTQRRLPTGGKRA